MSFLYVFGTGILTLSFFGVLNRGVEFAARLKEIDSDLFFIVTPLFATHVFSPARVVDPGRSAHLLHAATANFGCVPNEAARITRSD